MAKRLNKNLVIALSLLGFACILALSVLMLTLLAKKDPQHYADRAERYAQEENWQQAAAFYGEAWNASKDARYLSYQGNALLQLGDPRKAIAIWRKAITVDPQMLDAHRRHLEVLLAFAQLGSRVASWQSVEEAAAKMLEVDEGNAYAHFCHGKALVLLKGVEEGNEERGRQELRLAAELAPEVLDYTLEKIWYAISKQRTAIVDKDEEEEATWQAEVDKLIDEMLARFSNPGENGSKARWVHGQILAGNAEIAEAESISLQRRGITDKAETLLAEAERLRTQALQRMEEGLEYAGDDQDLLFEAKLVLAQFLASRWTKEVQAGADRDEPSPTFTRSEALLRECIAYSPERFEPYVVLGQLYQAARRYEEVLEVCKERIVMGFSRQGLDATKELSYTVQLYLLASRSATAAAYTEKDQAKRSRWLKEAAEFAGYAVSEASTDPRCLSAAAQVALAQKDERRALELLRKADTGFKAQGRIDWPTKLTLARLHLELDEPGAAKALIEDVLEEGIQQRGGDPAFWVLYATTLLQTSDFERCIQVADQALSIAPSNAEAKRLKLVALGRLDRLPEAQDTVSHDGASDTTTALILRAEQKRAAGDIAGTIETLKEALKIDPANGRLVQYTAHLLVGQQDKPTARQIVAEALAADPDNTSFKTMAVELEEGLSEEERTSKIEQAIRSEKDAYIRALQLIDFLYARGRLEETLPHFEEAERLLISQGTPKAQQAGKRGLSQLLTKKLLAGARMDNDEMMQAVVTTATEQNIDGSDGKSFLGQYHMYKEQADLAISAFVDALRSQPTDAKTLGFLGRCYQAARPPRLDDAEVCFRRAIEANPNEGLAHKGLAQIAELQGDNEAFETHFARCEALLQDDPWLQAKLQERFEEQDPLTAIARREERLPAAPPTSEAELRNYAQSVSRLALLCDRAGETQKAQKYFNDLLLLELPEDERETLVSSVSNFYYRQGLHEDALRLLREHSRSQATSEDQANAMISVAAYYKKLNDGARMEESLLQAADLAETFEVARSLADFYFRTDQAVKAVQWYDKAVARGKLTQSPRLAQTMSARIGALLNRRLGDVESARQRIAEFRRDYPDDPRGLFWKSKLHEILGELDEAIDELTAYLEARPNNEFALFQRAQYHFSSGDVTSAVADLEALKDMNPAALELRPRIQLAHLYQQQGRKDMKLRELASIVNENPNSDRAINELVTLYIQEKRLADAEQILATKINQSVDNPNPKWFFRRGDVAVELGDYQRAMNDYLRAVDVGGYAAQHVVILLSKFLELNLAKEGVAYFESNRSRIQQTSAVVSRYAMLLAQAGKTDAAVEQFTLAMQLGISEGAAHARLVGRSLLSSAIPTKQAVELFSVEPESAAEARATDRIMVTLLLATDEIQQAHTIIERLIDSAASGQERAGLLAEEGETFQRMNNFTAAQEAYEEALSYDNYDYFILNNLAFLLSDKLGQHEVALPYARRAAGLMENPAILDTLGYIYVQLGQYNRGIGQLTRAVQLSPHDPLIHYHLGEAYRRGAQFDQARMLLKVGKTLAEETGDATTQEMISMALEKVERSIDAP